MVDFPTGRRPASRTPSPALPPGATDAHCHVFGPRTRFPFSPTTTYEPPDAPKEKLFALHDLLGIERCVVVQGACHGYDNRVIRDVIEARPATYLGVALLPVTVDDRTLADHASAGFRAVRFNFMPHLGTTTPISDVVALGRRLAEHGMHLHVHMHPSLIEQIGNALKGAPIPVVIDHMGRIDAVDGLDQQPFVHLLRLLEDKNFWVKVSGSERSSRQGPPYRDATPFAARLVRDYPDRVLWGTDWPHPNFPGEPPDDSLLVDLLGEICPTDAALEGLLVDNPQRLFRFPAGEAGAG